jgi:hypothetical protein
VVRPRYPSTREPLPPPLPPETRTVGQLVAETVRLYGRHFLIALPLGLPLAAADELALDLSLTGRVGVLLAFAPLFSLAYAGATVLAVGVAPPASAWLVAFFAGTVVFAPAALFFPWFALASVGWLALTGLVVPVAIAERASPRDAVRRAIVLGRADYVHAAGSLATLVVVFGLTRLALALLLRSQADNTIRVAIFLADVVVSPIVFLGGALLYVDQAARIGSPSRRRRRGDADLPDADDAHGTGREDAQVEPRSPA